MRQIAILLLLASATLLRAADAPKTGDFSTSFPEKSPLSDPAKLAQRGGWSLDQIKRQIDVNYDPTKETWQLHVPADYDGSKPFGLFIWINAGPKGDCPESWKKVLDDHHLICAGADNSGNPRAILIRMALALDAVHNLRKSYNVDEQRIYVGGVSGGGKVATMLGVGWPDAFRGGFYMVGTAAYHNVPTGEQGRLWPKEFNPPALKLLADSRKVNRHVFYTGENDMNRASVLAMAAAYKNDKFEHVTILDAPGKGHAPADAEWFEKGIAALDELPPAAPSTAKPSATKPSTRPSLKSPSNTAVTKP